LIAKGRTDVLIGPWRGLLDRGAKKGKLMRVGSVDLRAASAGIPPEEARHPTGVVAPHIPNSSPAGGVG